MKACLLWCSCVGFFAASFVLPVRADVLSNYGDVQVLATPTNPSPAPSGPYVWQITSNTAGIGYGGLELQISGALTPTDLTNLAAEYLMTEGTFGGGAPRFTLFDSSFNSAWIYWGSPEGGGTFSDPNGGTAWGNTGNYADLASSDIRVYSDGFGGDINPNTGVTWAQFVALTGTTDISYITLDLDGGFTGTQQMDVASFDVNGTDYLAPTPEPASMLLFGTGLLGIAGWLRRKRRASITRSVP